MNSNDRQATLFVRGLCLTCVVVSLFVIYRTLSPPIPSASISGGKFSFPIRATCVLIPNDKVKVEGVVYLTAISEGKEIFV